MRNFFAEQEGAKVVAVSSTDSAHPASNVLNEDESSFWVSTGMYPQDIVIELPAPAIVRAVTIKHTGIRSLSVHGTTELPRFKDLCPPATFAKRNIKELQQDTVEMVSNSNVHIRFVKISILNGWDSFVTVHSVTSE